LLPRSVVGRNVKNGFVCFRTAHIIRRVEGTRKGLMEVQREHSCMGQSPGEGTQSLFKKGVTIPIFYQVLVSMLFVAVIPVILLLVVSMGGTESIIGTIGTSGAVLLLTIGTILVVFLWSYFVAHHVTKPIVELSSIATRISRGYVPKEEIEVSSNDEIGELVVAFNKMVNTYRILDTLAKEEAETEQ